MQLKTRTCRCERTLTKEFDNLIQNDRRSSEFKDHKLLKCANFMMYLIIIRGDSENGRPVSYQFSSRCICVVPLILVVGPEFMEKDTKWALSAALQHSKRVWGWGCLASKGFRPSIYSDSHHIFDSYFWECFDIISNCRFQVDFKLMQNWPRDDLQFTLH